MNDLTTNEKKVLNNMSKEHDWDVLLGTIISELIGATGKTGTPVNAVAAKETLTVNGVVKHGQTLTINNPAVPGIDVYEFLADAAQTKDPESTVAVDISASTSKASQTLTMDTQPTAGDTVTIGAKVYIFVPVGTDNGIGEISIGANLAAAQAALIAAINGTDGINTPHPSVTAAVFDANICRISAIIGGTGGNAIVTTETFTAASNIFGAGTLALGSDCSAANAITALVAAITASGTQDISAVDGEDDTIVITADTAGATGNNVQISEDMANAVFTGGAIKLSGGVNGTVATGISFLVDNTYLYVSLGANTVSQANWRRIAIGEVF